MLGWLFGKGKSTQKQSRQGRRPRRSRSAERPTVASMTSTAGWASAQYSPYDERFARHPVPINQEILNSWPALVARSRALAKDDPYVSKFIKMARVHVVGHSGFSFTSACVHRSGQPAPGIRKAIETGWREYARKENCCAQERLNLRAQENLAVTQFCRDGEILIMDYRGPDEGPFGIRFRFLDPNLLPLFHRKTMRNGNEVKMGIEFDQRGRVVAYHLISTDASATWYYRYNGRGYIRVPAERIIHAYLYEYDGQLRGIPPTAAALLRLRRIAGYEEAEVIAARIGAMKGGFVETNDEGGAWDGEGSVMDRQEDEEADDSDVFDEPEIELEPGSFPYLQPGAKVTPFDPQHPNSGYDKFMKTALRGVASALNFSYNSLASDGEGVNFSTLRTFTQDDRDVWKELQNWLIENVLDVMFDRWLEHALLSGALRLDSGEALKLSMIDKYRSHSFQGRRWQWVDPFKDAQTARVELQERLTSRSQLIRDRGGDPEKLWQEIAKEEAILRDMGIPPVNPKNAAPMSDSKPETESDDDETETETETDDEE